MSTKDTTNIKLTISRLTIRNIFVTSIRFLLTFNNLSEDDPFGYIAQISAYAEANGVERAAFLAIDKQSGEICLYPNGSSSERELFLNF